MDLQKIFGILRTAAAAIGGFLVSLGYTDASTIGDAVQSLDTIGGAVLVIIAAVGSVIAKLRGNRDNPTPAQAKAKEPDAVDKLAGKAK